MRALTGALLLVTTLACTNGGDPGPAPSPTPTARAIGGRLLYATFSKGVFVAQPDGMVRLIEEERAEYDQCAWSGDGRYVAWTASLPGGGHGLFVYDVVTAQIRAVRDEGQPAEMLVGTASGFAMVDKEIGKRPELVVVDPARVVAGAAPRRVPLRLRAAGILAVRGDRMYVEQPKVGSAFTGGPSTIYEVALDGRATEVFTNERDMSVARAAFTAGGRRLVHKAGDRINPNRSREWVVVRDLAGERELEVPSPTLPGATYQAVSSIVTGADGQTVLTLYHRGAEGEEMGARAYVLDRTAWREVSADATWAATGPSGALAVIDGKNPAGSLSVDGHHIADDVECAAWAP